MKRFWFSLLAPPLGLGIAIAAYFAVEPLSLLGVSPPPAEQLMIELAKLDEQGIGLKVRATSADPVRIAQVQVDGAYWQFRQKPEGPLSRGESAWLRLPYPWVQGETHHVRVIGSTGATFDYTIEVAEKTPAFSLRQITGYGLLGLYVGVLPVALGMLFHPAIRRAGRRGLEFALALTLGLLAFLLLDTIQEGMELGRRAAPLFQGPLLVWLAGALTFLALFTLTRRRSGPERGLTLAWYIAFGIGLHNLGEGLAIGGSLAVGEAALGAFLVIGFTIHNLTEGVGIAAPLLEERLRWTHYVGLVALAGLPASVGTWLGAYAFAPHWSALCLGIGAGAILQVMVEVGAFLKRRVARDPGSRLVPGTALAGFAAGVVVMYATGFLTHV
jgi:zinc transporter ZupT